jgi:hypothetical protein
MASDVDQKLLLHAFGSLRSGIAGFHNIVVRWTPESLSALLRFVDEPIGVWGRDPPYAADGSALPWTTPALEGFRLWSLPINRQQLCTVVGREDASETFVCVLPQEVTDRDLERLLKRAVVNGAVYFENTWNELVELVPRWSWFAAPMGEMCPVIVFCTVDQVTWQRVRTYLQSTAVPFTELIAGSECDQWDAAALLGYNQRGAH